MNHFSGGLESQLGSSVTGKIDGKFDDGYLVTVNLGSDQLKGVLYHIPQALHMSQSSHTSDLPPHRHQKRSRLLLLDQLKSLPNGEDKVISKKIGLLWNNLTVAEKQICQEKG
ncbi:hypothetical protein P3X46_016990 [Hevea brasiliensis]|uniref:HMG box domain-containing protein n=1 Tax=Hevea brasiliensis TaxID=3981 RepID=A0ABQ9M0U3_HEVBR|nr:hypothetical protein P3X46_016990 [Hevea brasiliensis]